MIHPTHQGIYDCYDDLKIIIHCDDTYNQFYNKIYCNYTQFYKKQYSKIWQYAKQIYPTSKYFYYDNVQYNCFGTFFAEDNNDFEDGIYGISNCDTNYAYYKRYFIPKDYSL